VAKIKNVKNVFYIYVIKWSRLVQTLDTKKVHSQVELVGLL